MTNEEKQLLLKDLSARLAYGVVYHRNDGANIKLNAIDVERGLLNYTDDIEERECKPYLRSMDDMTEEERKEYEGFIIHRDHVNAWGQEWDIDCFSFDNSPRLIDWLNAHHFDYRGLIEKGLAIEATEGMYLY